MEERRRLSPHAAGAENQFDDVDEPAPRAVPPSALLVDKVRVVLDGNLVLDDLSLRVEPSEVVAVRGVSGAGKSTLLALVAGLLQPDSGEIWVDGARVDDLKDRGRSAHRLRRLGVVFQSDELLPELTLGENITLPLQLGGRRRSAARLRPLVEELAAELGIAEVLDRDPRSVSGGQLQRAAIARALVHEPALVLADEPTAALDEGTARVAIQLLIRLVKARRTAAVLVTHDPAIAAMCDRVLQLDQGRLADLLVPGAIT